MTSVSDVATFTTSPLPSSYNYLFQIMVYNETYSGSSQLKDPIEGFFKGWLPGGTVKYTPCGLAWRDMWGANRYAGVCGLVHRYIA